VFLHRARAHADGDRDRLRSSCIYRRLFEYFAPDFSQ
jgi:hypothetical protein